LRNMESLETPRLEGNVFIDRDGAAFQDILAFLRSGSPVVAHVPVSILHQEADFYGITGFQTTKKLFLPEATKRQDTIRGVFHDHTRQGLKRYCFVDTLPADVPSCLGTGGVKGCVNENDLAKAGFRCIDKTSTSDASPDTMPGDQVSSIDDDEEPIVFERTVITHYVDLSEFSVPDDGSTWDIVETREFNGQLFAVATKHY